MPGADDAAETIAVHKSVGVRRMVTIGANSSRDGSFNLGFITASGVKRPRPVAVFTPHVNAVSRFANAAKPFSFVKARAVAAHAIIVVGTTLFLERRPGVGMGRFLPKVVGR